MSIIIQNNQKVFLKKYSHISIFSLILIFSLISSHNTNNNNKKGFSSLENNNNIIVNLNSFLESESESDFSSIQDLLVPLFDYSIIVQDNNGHKSFNNKITQNDLFSSMGFGWNLGYSLDSINSAKSNEGLSSEISWGNPMTSESLIQFIASSGIKTLRIPITWHNHFLDTNFTIDPQWMLRLKYLVDLAIKYKLYVIINTQNDNAFEPEMYNGLGYYPSLKARDESVKFLYNIWTQIAIAFNNGYDEHLIFEGLDEPRLIGEENEWNFDEDNYECKVSAQMINLYQKVILKAIRNTGGNNQNRFFLMTTYDSTFSNEELKYFEFPDDESNQDINKILLSVHVYLPEEFAENPDTDFSKFEDHFKKDLSELFNELNEKVISKGHFVIITEFGAVNKNNNIDERIKWANFIIQTAKNYQISCILWDNGFFGDDPEDSTDVFGQLHRYENDLKWESEEFIQSCVSSAFTGFGGEGGYTNIEEEDYCGKNFLKSYVVFDNWQNFVQIDIQKINKCKEFKEIGVETGNGFFMTMYREMKIMTGDWKDQIKIKEEEIEGGEINEDDEEGNIKILEGDRTLVIRLNEENLRKIRDNDGFILLGHGFIIKKVYIDE